MRFAVDNAHRLVRACVVPAFACLVLGKPSAQICGDAGVERLVGALNNIDRVHGANSTPCSQNPYFLLFSRSYCAVRQILGYRPWPAKPVRGQANGRTMHWYVYILRSLKDGGYYVGLTSNPTNRLAYHNAGKVRSTKFRKPFELLYKEAYATRAEAREREKYLKSYKGASEKLSIIESVSVK